MSHAIPLWWWSDPSMRPNFGDALSPRIVEALSRRPVVKTVRPAKRTLACGSVVKWAGPGDVLWGCGHGRETHSTASALDVRAVRGPLTGKMVAEANPNAQPVYGDCALLLPLLYRPSLLWSEPRHDAQQSHASGLDGGTARTVCFVPHYVDYARVRKPLLASAAKCGLRAQVVNVLGSIERSIDTIASSSYVVSSSLHGLVVADAYRVPSRWVEFSDLVVGNGFKFRDYMYAIGRTDEQALDLRDIARINEVDWKNVSYAIASRKALEKAQSDLLRVAPFEVKRIGWSGRGRWTDEKT